MRPRSTSYKRAFEPDKALVLVRHALDTAPNLQQAIIGAVLNKTDMDHLPQYDVQHKSMYQNKYYARYASLDTN